MSPSVVAYTSTSLRNSLPHPRHRSKGDMVLQDGSIVHFKAKITTPFRKLMTAYCDRQSVAAESVVFLFEGERLRGEQTPQEVSC